MKKRLFSAMLCLVLAFTLLPTAALAAETRLKHLDIVIDLPKAGEPCDMETQVTVKSIKSGSIDLLANGSVSIPYTIWMGDDVETEDDEFLFRAGTTYLVTVKLDFDIAKGYCANYKMVSGSPVVGPDSFSATVNGVPATVRSSAPYYTTLQVSLTIEGDRFTESEKSELAVKQEEDAAALAASWRAMYSSRTQAESDAQDLDKISNTVVVMDGSDRKDGYNLGYLSGYSNVGTLIMDVDDSAFYNNYCAEEFTTIIKDTPSITEVWLSPKYSVADFVERMDASLRSPLDHSLRYESRSDLPFYTAKATVFIPESMVPELKECLTHIANQYKLVYTVKTYSGSDVYAAQKAGASAAKDWCAKHDFSAQILSADRAYTYSSCQTYPLWYYSCSLCGKCEYNPKHVNVDLELYKSINDLHLVHSTLLATLPNDSAYVGVNAAGEYVYWYSCDLCGKSERYLQQHLTAEDAALSGNGGTLAQFQEEANATLKMRETLALSSTEGQAGMFTMHKRSTAKASAWAQSDVNLALNDNLLDTDLLGNDYTKNITRLQFCSVAVRLAEELTGKSIAPAPAGTFTDTTNAYALKAYAAGITTGTTATTFDPNGTLTRAQMAAFLYRTLRYVEKNSDYSYTGYTSKLSSYADSAQVQGWAKESMAFMNALGLIKGTTATTLSPNGKCTIEQAVAVAERSVYAHLIGWYQVVTSNSRIQTLPVDGTGTNTSFRAGDYVWATGKRLGLYNEDISDDFNLPYTFLPVVNPYTQQVEYLANCDLRPVRG